MHVTPNDGAVVVTGAGGGLGRALVREIAARGFPVVAVGRDLTRLEETAHALTQVRPLVLDVAQPAMVRREFAALGPISVLINNAATYPRRDFLAESGESFAETMSVNLGGVANCTRAALGDMVTRGQGRVLNVATFADLDPLPASAGYAVSKGAARILTRALVADLADRFPGIVISDWMPGMLATSMGVPDGVAPEVSARWGATLALSRDPALMGSVFEMDREILPPRGLKGRVKDALLLRRRKARVVGDL